MTWLRLFSPCWFSHEEPIKVLKKGKLHMECPRCHADRGVVLPKQRYRERKPARVLPFTKRKRA